MCRDLPVLRKRRYLRWNFLTSRHHHQLRLVRAAYMSPTRTFQIWVRGVGTEDVWKKKRKSGRLEIKGIMYRRASARKLQKTLRVSRKAAPISAGMLINVAIYSNFWSADPIHIFLRRTDKLLLSDAPRAIYYITNVVVLAKRGVKNLERNANLEVVLDIYYN